MKLKLVLLAMLVSLLLLAGCSSSKGTESGSESNAGKDLSSNSATKDVTINFLHWRGEDVESINQIIDAFEEENPHIKVQMNTYPTEQYQQVLLTQLKGGGAGDVFASFPGAQFNSILQADMFTDLSNEDFIERFAPHLISAGQDDKGTQYAIPYQLVYNIPVYNVGMFEEYGIEPPQDWEGFLEMCEVLKQHGKIPLLFPGQSGAGARQFMNPMMMNNEPDEEIWDLVQSGQRKITEDWWVKTLSQFKELKDKGYFEEDPMGVTMDMSGTMMAQEKGGIVPMGSYMMAQIKEQNPNIKLGLLSPITVSKDEKVWDGIHTTTFMLAVNKQSKHPVESKKFIEFLTRPEYASIYANGTGQLVTVSDVNYESEVLKSTLPWLDKKTRFQPRFMITNGRVDEAVTFSIEKVMTGSDPETAAKEAQALIDQAISK